MGWRSLVFWAGLASVSCGNVPEEPWAAKHQAIIGGAADTGDPAVVYIIISSGTGQAAAATGTLVSSHVVLTAAHVLSVFDTPTFRVFVGDNQLETGSNADNWRTVREAHADPNFNSRVITSGHDVAVLVLSSPLAVTPLRFNRQPATLSWIGTSIRTVGYGIIENTDVTGSTAGVRRQGTSAISNVTSYTFLSSTGGEQPCGGDSGGPAFVNIDGVELIAGLVSNGDATCAGVTFARVDTSAAFVDQWIAKIDPDIESDAGADAPSEIMGSDDAGAVEDAAEEPLPPNDPTEAAPSSDGCAMGSAKDRSAGWPAMAMAIGLALAVLRRRRARAS